MCNQIYSLSFETIKKHNKPWNIFKSILKPANSFPNPKPTQWPFRKRLLRQGKSDVWRNEFAV